MTIQNYLSFFDEMMRPTAALFELVPEQKLEWKPTAESFTMGQLMAHMVLSLQVYGRGIASGDWGLNSMREIFLRNRHTPSWNSVEAVAKLHESYGEFKHLLSQLTDEEFDGGIINTPQLGNVPRWRAAMLAVEHHLNHKAELFMYLKVLGVKVHTGHLYRG